MEPNRTPVMPEQPTPTPAPVAPQQPGFPAQTEDPGKTLGIASFILSLVGVGLIGLILGLVAKKKSKKAGFKNGFALAGIIIGAVVTFITIIVAIFGVLGIMAVNNKCTELGGGVHTTGGTTITCGDNYGPNKEASASSADDLSDE